MYGISHSFFLFTLILLIVPSLIAAYFIATRNKLGLKTPGVLTVGMYPEFKPYEYTGKDGELVGYDVDFICEVARRMNVKLAIVSIEFEKLIPALQLGEVDLLISGLAITPDRLAQVDMVPYHGRPLRGFALMFWREIPDGVNSIEDLARQPNRKVAVQVGTMQEDFLLRYNFLQHKPVVGSNGLLLDIRHGSSVASLVRIEEAYALQSENPKIKILNVPIDEKDWILGDGIAIQKGNRVLTRAIEYKILDLREDGFSLRNHIKWFGNTGCGS